MSNSNNNLFNNNLFQQTPQKGQGWPALPPPQNPSSQPAQPTNLFGAQQGMNPQPFSTQPTLIPPQPPQFGSSLVPPQPANFAPSLTSSFGTSNLKPSQPPPFGSFSTGFNPQSNLLPQPSLSQPSASSFTSTSSFPSSSFALNKPSQSFGSSNWPSLSQNISHNTWNSSGQGSKAIPYSVSRFKEDSGVFSDAVDITAMKEYANKSVDEIRHEDYTLSRKPTNVGTIRTGFGTNQVTSQPTVFSSSTPANTFGMSQPVAGSTPAFNNGITGFNSTNSGIGINRPSLFGNTSMAQNNTNMAPTGMPIHQPNTLIGQQFGMNENKPANMPTSIITGQPAMPANLTNQPSNMTAGISLFGNSQPFSAAKQPALPVNLFSQSAFQPAGQPTIQSASVQPTSIFGAQPNASNISAFQTNSGSLINNLNGMYNTTGNVLNNSINNYNSNINYNSDPYLIKDLEFEKSERQRPSIRAILPETVFDNSRREASTKLEIRPPRTTAKSGIFTIPEIKSPNKTIETLIVGIEGKGRIEYLEPVMVPEMEEIERKIKFNGERVSVLDPPGMGLNRRARVYVEGLFPYSRTAGTHIKGIARDWPEKGIQERFIYNLKNCAERKFMDYNANTGLYVYEVNHF